MPPKMPPFADVHKWLNHSRWRDFSLTAGGKPLKKMPPALTRTAKPFAGAGGQKGHFFITLYLDLIFYTYTHGIQRRYAVNKYGSENELIFFATFAPRTA